ncbi:uncharacterized protein LOC124172687 [Ischnura elegans]|uniref:uncharacterized protein LOC124172687 n=1 Tax=Ischnura elegans TaxID=197161 RepID=UPI001ED8948F|nr:uncharacterized protein LOC124172687 [Ischnura elegans]
MEPGFVKACSNNLPVVDPFMIGVYLSSNADFAGSEQRGVKLARSARENYGDSAIGYVQIKRDGGKCWSLARVTPEHKVKVKPHIVEIVVNEDEGAIEEAKCHGCAAALGGCKHAIAFLFWLHRRSEEPSPTEVESYWKKSKLSALCGGSQLMKVREMTGAAPIIPVREGSFREEVIAALKEQGHYDSALMSLTHHLNVKEMTIHHMLLNYKAMSDQPLAARPFLDFATSFMANSNLCELAFRSTVHQHASPLWHSMRQGRITASRMYEAIHCQKRDGALVNVILGAKSIPDNDAMRRGRELEGKVICVLERSLGRKIGKCGVALNPKYPFLAATPDGIYDDILVEVKCPINSSSFKHYLRDGAPTAKCLAQIMVQMLMLGKQKCVFAVADPAFESNEAVYHCIVDYNDDYTKHMVEKSMLFWCDVIFPLLK